MHIPFFSIIIPVYNGLTHDLPICLDSIRNQPLDKNLYEVICVDDCSTDGTRQWLKEQSPLHTNLRIIENQSNVRQGGARNRGVKAAIGKYIMFIDQDDYFHQGAFKSIYDHLNISNENLDVFVSDSSYQFKGHESNKLQLNLTERKVMTGEEFLLKNGPVYAPWRLCLKKDFVITNNLWFVEKCRIEDVDWACRVLFYAKAVQYQPILLVHYIKGENGTTDNMYRNDEILIANILAASRTLDVANSLYVGSKAQQCIFNVVDMYYNFSCRYLFGMWRSIHNKTKIINLITPDHSKYRMVNFATKYPMIFSIISNVSVPMFRIIRYLRRWRKARGQ